MDALDRPGKHRVFRGGPPRFRWVAYCPNMRQTYSFPTWVVAMSLRNCCDQNQSDRHPPTPPTQTITDVPEVKPYEERSSAEPASA